MKERRRTRQPLFVVLMWFGAAAMTVPGIHAFALGNEVVGRAFLSSALLFVFCSGIVALALRGRLPDESAFSQLAALLAAFALLPVGFAVPLWFAVGTGSFYHAWFEMISAFTTTGATLFAEPADLPPSVNLWRALVGWLGGLLMWVSAMAIFAPLNLGGFEVRASVGRGDFATRFIQVTRTAGPYERLDRYFAQLGPIYVALTAVLWIGLILAGEDSFSAICHALSVLATSGVAPTGEAQVDSLAAEFLVVLFLVLAISRRSYGRGLPGENQPTLSSDPEFQLGLAIIGLASVALFARHWIGSYDGTDAVRAFEALWGGLFTVASFLTTFGYESRFWDSATLWSGLETPGLVLVGLAIFGGGIGTTAGGVKLLRVYALYKHGHREIERLVHPSSVGGQGAEARRIRREGAMIAWVFFMLYAMSITAIMLLLSLTGVSFEDATVLTVAALSNCGPLAAIGGEVPISFADVPDAAQAVLAAAMVLGRLELLAIIALLNPDFWRG